MAAPFTDYYFYLFGGAAMDVLTAIQGRRSIRKYSDKAVEEDKLNLVLEAARLAPSAGNWQDWKFIVVKDKKLRAKLADAAEAEQFVKQSPVVIVACGTKPEPVMACGQHKYTVDLSIATSYMTLEAHELGLGTCWLGHFYEDKVKETLNIPDSVRVVALLSLGYPAEEPAPRTRKKMEDIVCVDIYG